jgi:hypothetical protein
MSIKKKTGTKRIIANILMGAAALLNAYAGDVVPTEASVPAIAIINVLLNVIGKRKDDK